MKQIQQFSAIAAMDSTRGIGKEGAMPWYLPRDVQYFHHMTMGNSQNNAVIMGRRTWDSLPPNRKPLAQRINIVVSRKQDYEVPDSVHLASSFEDALNNANQMPVEETFVIGGGEIYKLAVEHPGCSRLLLTQIKSVFNCDTFFPDYEDEFEAILSSDVYSYDGLRFSFHEFHKRPEAERKQPGGPILDASNQVYTNMADSHIQSPYPSL